MRIVYNAPVSLSLTLGGLLVFGLNFVLPGLVQKYFASPAGLAEFGLLDGLRSVSYVLGHGSWQHYASNALFLLLVGPAVEEKYGSWKILGLCLLTAVVTALISALLFSTPLMGASGLVFMFIILASITNVRQGELPLTFVLVAGLFLGREGLAVFRQDNISQLAHVLGGACGGAFGLFFGRKQKSAEKPQGPQVQVL